MKVGVIFLLCALALAHGVEQQLSARKCNCDPSEAQQICRETIGTENVLIAHENCDRFYKCANGRPIAYTCPNNLLYDPVAETCNWPAYVDCGDRPISDGTEPDDPDCDGDTGGDSDNDNDNNDGTCNCNPGEAPAICAAEGSNGVFVAHENCNQFYMCAEGNPVAITCPPTLLYNPYRRVCDWPQNVDCGDRVIPEPDDNPGSDNDNGGNDNGGNDNGTCNCNPEEAPAICAAPDSEGVLVAHENCNQFYMCNFGRPVVLTCPENLLYNPYTERCDWPSNVQCGDRVVPEPESGCSICDDSNESDDIDDLPLPDDDGGNDNEGGGNDNEGGGNDNEGGGNDNEGGDNDNEGGLPSPPPPPDNENNSNENVGGGNCDPSEAPTICAADDSEDVLVAHENCNQFYICSGGKPVALTCPDNLFFNPNTDTCDWPENVECGDRLIPDPDDEDSGNDNDNGGNDNDGNDNDGNDNGGNDNDGNDNGTCNCNPDEAPAICAADDSNGVLIAHENCNQFFICDHGKPVVLTCPGNLLYNPYTERCDWPENVECGNRVIPDPDDVPGNDNDGNDNGGNDNDGNDNGGNDNNGNDNGGNDNDGNDNGTCNCNPEEAPAICAADDSSGVLIAHENCNQFYICDHGKPIVLSCPGNLLYNPYTEQCDWPENVKCGDRVIPDPDDAPGNDNDNGGNDNDGNDNGGNDNDGNDNGGNDNDGNDNGGNDNGTCNCNPEEAPAICAADDSSGVLIAHENCNQFYICDHGKPIVLSCPGNLLYNPYTEQCDWPENVKCGDRVIPDPDDAPGNDNDNGGNDNDGNDNGGNDNDGNDNGGNDNDGNDNGGNDNGTCNCNPEEAPAICAADDSSGVLIAHENCNQFYICDHGKPVVLSCPGNLLYNPYTEQCDWPENVKCGDRVIPDPDDAPGNDNDNDGNDNGGNDNDGNDNGGNDNDGNDNGGNDNDGNDNGTCNCNPEEAPAICAADDSSGVLIAHENCNQFYICDHGKPVVLSCPGNLLYNPYTEQCDWPENVKCGDRVIPDPDDAPGNDNDNGGNDNDGNDNGGNDNDGNDNDGNDNGTCNCNPEEAPAICAADDSSGVLIAHENCNQFYICDHGKPVVLSCPGNLLYNPYTEQCDWPENVKCGDRVIPDPDDAPGNDNDNGGNDNDGNDNGGNDNDGNDNGGNDNDGNDNGGNDNGTCNCNPEEAPAICAADDSSGVLIAHENCNQFYICDHGKPVVLSCPGNLLYNPYTEQCDWPENVKCGDRVIPDPDDAPGNDNDNDGNDNGGNDNDGNDNGGNDNDGNDNGGNDNDGNDNGTCNCNPEEAPAICAADDSSGVLIAHENCNQFYICDHGKPVVLSCPGNLLYNPYTEQCDWPENVKCGDRVIPDPDDAPGNDNDNGGNDNDGNDNGGNDNDGNDNGGNDNDGNDNGTCNCNPEEAPAICAADDSSGVLIAHENCNQFYICDHGKPVVLSCPGNLLYNPYTEQCDWPENVKCGDRVIPDPDDAPGNDNDNGGNDNDGNDNGGNDNDGNDNGGNDNDGNDNGGNDNGTCNCNPEEAPAICAADDSSGVLIAHENCNQFYICDHGKPVVLSCPGNLLYNPYTEQCDWPENVKCGDRVIPDPDDAPGNDNDNGGNDNDGNDNGGNDNDGNDNGGNDNDGNDNGGNDNDGNDNGTCNCNPDEAPAICAADDSSGVLIAHENCNQFFICDHGKPVVLTCPGNLLYNPYTERCDWPENVECGDRVIPDPDDEDNNGNDNGGNDNDGNDNDGNDNDGNDNDGNDNDGNDDGTCNCNPEEAPAICAADDSYGILIAHENCNQFYKCDHGLPVVFSCPGDLLYNPYTERCDWPENVDCGDRNIPETDDTDNGNDNDGSEEIPPGGDDNDNGNDNNGSEEIPPGGDDPGNDDDASVEIPPGGDDPGNDNDGDENDSDCDEDDNDDSGTCNCRPEDAPSICGNYGSNGVLIAHENCNQFYQCSNGQPIAQRCPAGLLYDPVAQICDWPFNVECGDRVIPEPDNDDKPNDSKEEEDSDNGNDNGTCNCNPEEAPAICAVEGSEGVLIAHENCNQFYKCSYGSPIAFLCPPSLLYNPYTEQCDWPQNVECGNRVIPEPDDDNNNDDNDGDDNTGDDNGPINDDPSQAPTICADSGSNGVLVAHENCNKFYLCSGGSPVAISCSAGLLFNPVNRQCDWPLNVDCGDRIVPDGNDNDCACNPRNAPSLCSEPLSNGQLIAHENCNQYYVCHGGVPVPYFCGGNTLFNVDKAVCDLPQEVNCNSRMLTFSSLNKHLESRQSLKK